jgi:hypothetical protein
MIPPGEIKMVNIDGRSFLAHPCRTVEGRGYIYNPVLDAFRFRVAIPGVEVSLIVVPVTTSELREFVNTGKPVLIRPQ